LLLLLLRPIRVAKVAGQQKTQSLSQSAKCAQDPRGKNSPLVEGIFSY